MARHPASEPAGRNGGGFIGHDGSAVLRHMQLAVDRWEGALHTVFPRTDPAADADLGGRRRKVEAIAIDQGAGVLDLAPEAQGVAAARAAIGARALEHAARN